MGRPIAHSLRKQVYRSQTRDADKPSLLPGRRVPEDWLQFVSGRRWLRTVQCSRRKDVAARHRRPGKNRPPQARRRRLRRDVGFAHRDRELQTRNHRRLEGLIALATALSVENPALTLYSNTGLKVHDTHTLAWLREREGTSSIAEVHDALAAIYGGKDAIDEVLIHLEERACIERTVDRVTLTHKGWRKQTPRTAMQHSSRRGDAPNFGPFEARELRALASIRFKSIVTLTPAEAIDVAPHPSPARCRPPSLLSLRTEVRAHPRESPPRGFQTVRADWTRARRTRNEAQWRVAHARRIWVQACRACPTRRARTALLCKARSFPLVGARTRGPCPMSTMSTEVAKFTPGRSTACRCFIFLPCERQNGYCGARKGAW